MSGEAGSPLGSPALGVAGLVSGVLLPGASHEVLRSILCSAFDFASSSVLCPLLALTPCLGALPSLGPAGCSRLPCRLRSPGQPQTAHQCYPDQLLMCFSPGWLGPSPSLSSLFPGNFWPAAQSFPQIRVQTMYCRWIGTLFQMTPGFARLSENRVTSIWAVLSVRALAVCSVPWVSAQTQLLP